MNISKERQILFTAPMVRAVLDGTKTQTRRIMKPQPEAIPGEPGKHWWPASQFQSMMRIEDGCNHPDAAGMAADASPYGSHGSLLWVRETFFAYGRWETRWSKKKRRDEWHFVDMTVESDRGYQYAADTPKVALAKSRGTAAAWWKRPAIFMPRTASRIQLRIAHVRVQRLQEISEIDAVAEGIGLVQERLRSSCVYGMYYCCMPDGKIRYGDSAYELYGQLWEQINGAGSWAANPWVWVVEFENIKLPTSDAGNLTAQRAGNIAAGLASNN